jgi:putative membrane protein insertion efficiency factor
MTRRPKPTSESCAEEAVKAFVTIGCNECSKGCSKAFVFTIFVHLKDIFMAGLPFVSMRKYMIAAIKRYQVSVSPKLNVQCLFEPSCSNYAIMAIEKYGAMNGIVKALIRIVRCSPLTCRRAGSNIPDLP